MTDRPVGAVIEVIERRPQPTDPTHAAGDVVVPTEVRINGQRLLMPANSPVTVHEVEIREHDPVLVTLTLFAKRVVIGVEEPAREEVADRG